MSCPESQIIGPEDRSSVTTPTEIIGTVTADGFIYYVLEYACVGDDAYTEIAKGTEPVEDGVLGIFDTTLLTNGWYTIRLTGYGSNYHTVDEIALLVEGQMKIGNYSVSFRDMDIPVQRFPLTVLRNYDSRYKNKSGDFGYGWNLSMAGATLSESCVPGEYWIQEQGTGPLGLSKFYFAEERPHTIVIDWGNGKVDKFDMKLTPDSQPLMPIQYDISVSYTAQLGTYSKLEALGETTGLIYAEGLLYQSNLNVYHPEKYKLTTEDGTVYIINANTGVESITDVNGNVITFDEDGVYHSDGKSIVFNRDDKGRISKITGPTGKQVSYQYNENGDLASVTDILGGTTKFVYDEEHYLSEIIDPRGIKVARNEYDGEGRLIATIDAGGNRTEFKHDIDSRREAIRQTWQCNCL